MYQRTGKKDTPSVEKTARTAPFDPRQRSTQRRKPGRRGGIRRRLRQRKFRPALPSMILANLRSIQNRIEEIRRYARYSFEFREAALLCFTETWLHAAVSDSLYNIEGFSLIRTDRNENSGKTWGGGVCTYINENFQLLAWANFISHGNLAASCYLLFRSHQAAKYIAPQLQ